MSQITEGSPFQTEDLFVPNITMFSIPAIKILMHKCAGTLHEWNEEAGVGPDGEMQYVRKVVPVSFLGLRTRESAVNEVAEIMACKISELADKGFILAALAPLISVKLARTPVVVASGQTIDNTLDGETQVCIMSYLAITDEGVEYAKERWPHLFVQTGGVPYLIDIG